MALIPLDAPEEWGWDTTAQQLVMRIRLRETDPEAPPPTREAIVRFAPASVNIRDIPPVVEPDPPPTDE